MIYPALIRSSALAAYSDVVRELGGNPGPLLAQFRIEEKEIGAPLHMVPLASVIELLETTSRAIERPDFGLRLAEQQSVNTLGPLAIIAAHSTSVLEGIENISRYMHFHSPAISLLVDNEDKSVNPLWRLTITIEEPVARRQFLQLSLYIMVKIMRMLCGKQWRPVSVMARHSPEMPESTYRKILGAPVQFSHRFNALELRHEDLLHTIDHSDRDMCRLMEFFMKRFMADYGGSLTNRVRGILAEFLGSMPRGAMAIVASQFSMSEQELQKKLQQEGTTFEFQLEDVRKSLARHYLENGNMNMTEVAAALGYAEQSSLNRACKRWFGMSPKNMRSAAALKS